MEASRLNELLLEYSKHPSPELMEQLVEGFIGIPRSIATRFVGHGIEYDDLFQVASIALMKAIERFDPEKGYKFITYATPTITGDLRNYIRDKKDLIKASRATKILLYKINKLREKFLQEQFREPNMQEIADELGIGTADVVDALMTQNALSTVSLDAKPDDDDDKDNLYQFLQYEEEGYKRLDDKEFVQWVKDHTTAQEFDLLHHRFVQNMSQREVASLLKVSQMQVSRLERRIFQRLNSLADKLE